MLRKVVPLLLAAVPTTVSAEWKSATSNHYIVYTEGTEASARDIAQKLEKHLFVLKAVSAAKGADSPVKVRVFMVGDRSTVSDVLPLGGGDGLAGFYSATLDGAFAVMPRAEYKSIPRRGEAPINTDLSMQQVLQHELTHHFMYQYYPAAYPTWYSEGFADFYGAASIGPKDVVTLGLPVANRYLGFQDNQWLPVPRMLAAHSYAEVAASISELYAQGWLLVHYLTTTNNRPGQLAAYLNAINAGQPFGSAARSAFGDLNKLDAELHAHAARGKLQTMVLPFKPIDTGPIEVKSLSPAEGAMMPYTIRMQAGIPAARAGEFADQVKQAATHYPDDPAALRTLADAELLARRAADAAATADRWAAAAPADGMALAEGDGADGSARLVRVDRRGIVECGARAARQGEQAQSGPAAYPGGVLS